MSEGRTVLAVDDDPGVLQLLRVGLEYEGYLVQTARSGTEAMKFVESSSPLMVILDVMLTDMNGFEV